MVTKNKIATLFMTYKIYRIFPKFLLWCTWVKAENYSHQSGFCKYQKNVGPSDKSVRIFSFLKYLRLYLLLQRQVFNQNTSTCGMECWFIESVKDLMVCESLVFKSMVCMCKSLVFKSMVCQRSATKCLLMCRLQWVNYSLETSESWFHVLQRKCHITYLKEKPSLNWLFFPFNILNCLMFSS